MWQTLCEHTNTPLQEMSLTSVIFEQVVESNYRVENFRKKHLYKKLFLTWSVHFCQHLVKNHSVPYSAPVLWIIKQNKKHLLASNPQHSMFTDVFLFWDGEVASRGQQTDGEHVYTTYISILLHGEKKNKKI